MYHGRTWRRARQGLSTQRCYLNNMEIVKRSLLRIALRLLPLKGRKWLMRKLDKDYKVIVELEGRQVEMTLDVFLDNYEIFN